MFAIAQVKEIVLVSEMKSLAWEDNVVLIRNKINARNATVRLENLNVFSNVSFKDAYNKPAARSVLIEKAKEIAGHGKSEKHSIFRLKAKARTECRQCVNLSLFKNLL